MTATIASILTIDHSGIIVRPLISLVVALAVTTGLFLTMQYLIEINDTQLNDETTHTLLDFVRIKRDEEIERVNRIMKPRIPELPPMRPPQIDMADPTASPITIWIPEVPVDPQIITTNSAGNMYEGDYLPIVKVAPIYPPRALSRGIQGYCVVEYTVTRQGTIRDPMVVNSQCTSSLFHRVSIDAAQKFKYKPRVMHGEAVEVSGVQNKFTFQIMD